MTHTIGYTQEELIQRDLDYMVDDLMYGFDSITESMTYAEREYLTVDELDSLIYEIEAVAPTIW